MAVTTGLQIQSTIKKEGILELALAEASFPQPQSDEVLVRIEAAPINPSDLGIMFGTADMSRATAAGSVERPIITAPVPEKLMRGMAARIDQSVAVGNEGAGVVIDAGSSEQARMLMGKTVAVYGGAYSQYRVIKARDCLLLPEGTTATEGASSFINPLTALSMVEAMRLEGHGALVHAAAASNLGQMLQKLCIKDGIDLVNIVRKPEQEEILRALGAKYVCNSSSPDFMADLTKALSETGATLAFDPIGGGKLTSQILTCMESATSSSVKEYRRYGSSTHKQVYIYGSLDRSPTELSRNYGMAWGIGGWVLTHFLQKLGYETEVKLLDRVAAELKTTFASSYVKALSLADVLQLDEMKVYGKPATGEKYLIEPCK